MNKRELQRTMYELTRPTHMQRVTLAVIAGAWVLLVWWLLEANGISFVEKRVGLSFPDGNTARRLSLAAAFTIYYVRLLFTLFIFLKRGIGWSEVFTIVPWLIAIVLLLGIEGGTNPAPFGIAAICGAVLFILGSWINTHAEYARHRWKQRAENHGKLYTRGFFRFARHPNYFGDLVSTSGLCLITGKWLTAIVPVLMLAGFVFINIPVLDAHLRDHYGAAFDDYASRTRKLIPFVY
ncbi:MAG TPA: DUF1295 domain-containing protein [Terracidiphilus sp.]|nr:DUF1295 domain-containing protein [Terracidiphilus sp.]